MTLYRALATHEYIYYFIELINLLKKFFSIKDYFHIAW